MGWRALMAEAFRKLRAHGAEVALVETDRDRTAALRAYATMGFEVAHTVQRKGRYVEWALGRQITIRGAPAQDW